MADTPKPDEVLRDNEVAPAAGQTESDGTGGAGHASSGDNVLNPKSGAAANAGGQQNQETSELRGGNVLPAPKVQKRPLLVNLEQFLDTAYARKGQPVSLKRDIERRLASQPGLDAAARERVIALARTDTLLAVPRQLLLVAFEIVGYPKLKESLCQFVTEVLLQHPAFASSELSELLRGLPDAAAPTQALETLARLDYSRLPRVTPPPMKKKQVAALRANAVYCLATWLVLRGHSIEKVTGYLHSALWRPDAARVRTPLARLRSITEIRDLAGVGLACESFWALADEQIRFARSAGEARGMAEQEVRRLAAALATADQVATERQGQVEALEAAARAEKERMDQAQIHVYDAHERLRTRVLRRLKSEVLLLEEGLHALRRDPPKVHVMLDRADRALDALKAEISELESEA